MEMRILVPDAASASSLAEQLVVACGSDHITLRGERREVDVLIDREPAIVRVVDTVERWLEQTRVGTVELRLGQHSYRLARASPVESWS